MFLLPFGCFAFGGDFSFFAFFAGVILLELIFRFLELPLDDWGVLDDVAAEEIRRCAVDDLVDLVDLGADGALAGDGAGGKTEDSLSSRGLTNLNLLRLEGFRGVLAYIGVSSAL